jgi:WS/DGAT/MGAT family acyltransferase
MPFPLSDPRSATDLARRAAWWFRDGDAVPLSALDTTFLEAETPDTPLHLGAVARFEGGPLLDAHGELRLDDVRAGVAARLHLFPRFRQRVVAVPGRVGRPVWVDDDTFDIADHVRVHRVGSPGDRAAWLATAGDLTAAPLDLTRPLWELWFVTGLADGTVGMVEKVHHAMIDGVSGVEVAAALLDLEPDADRGEPAAWSPRPAPGPGRLLARAAGATLVRPAAVARAVGDVAAHPTRVPQTVARTVGAAVDTLTTAVRTTTNPAPASLHRAVGCGRRIEAVSRPLEDVRLAGRAMGATVNDVVLAAVSAGLQALLTHRGEPTDGVVLEALVPVSVRSDDEHLALGNRVAALIVPLPVGVPTTIRRLADVARATAARKAAHQAEHTELLMDSADLLPLGLLGAIARSIHRQPMVDVVVTNIPGVGVPLYFLGARLLESIPIVPLAGNLPVGVAVLSYDGELTIGLHADGAACPDLDVLAAGIAADLDELLSRTAPAGGAETAGGT